MKHCLMHEEDEEQHPLTLGQNAAIWGWVVGLGLGALLACGAWMPWRAM